MGARRIRISETRLREIVHMAERLREFSPAETLKMGAAFNDSIVRSATSDEEASALLEKGIPMPESFLDEWIKTHPRRNRRRG